MFLIDENFTRRIDEYLDEHYDLEKYEVIGERGKVTTFLEDIEIFFRKIFHNFDGYFLWYLSKKMKEKNFTEEQLIEKAHLDKKFFSILRQNEYIEIPKEYVVVISLVLQLNFVDVNKLFDLAWSNNLYVDDKRDVIIAYFIENKIDDVSLLDKTLEHYNLRNLNEEKIFPDEMINLSEVIDKFIEKNYYYPVKYSVSGDFHAKKVAVILEEHKKTFSEYLRELIKEKNLSEVEVYKKAHLDRRIFSKIRNEKNYKPSTNTVLAICIGMELNLEETENLLRSAGHGLSTYYKTDLIVRYFIENKIYDLNLINEVLDFYEQKPISN